MQDWERERMKVNAGLGLMVALGFLPFILYLAFR